MQAWRVKIHSDADVAVNQTSISEAYLQEPCILDVANLGYNMLVIEDIYCIGKYSFLDALLAMRLKVLHLSRLLLVITWSLGIVHSSSI